MNSEPIRPALAPPILTAPALLLSGRLLILAVAFLGWLCAGVHMSITQLAGQPAAIELLDRTGALDAERFHALNKRPKDLSPTEFDQLKQWRALVASWFAWYQCAFLFGAATGGLVLGWLGDRFGRSKGMALSILTYSSMAGAAHFAQSPLQLLLLWYLACLGVGGMWPNGVALVAEVWSTLSRPVTAGIIGTSANVGIFLFATLAAHRSITAENWRWVMLVGATPVVLGLFALLAVPESPRWLATRAEQHATQPAGVSIGEVFRRPLLSTTLLGIALATVPIIGGWGSAIWMIPWADTMEPPVPTLKAHIGQYRSMTGIVGSLLGGGIAGLMGRRRTYFLVSLFALAIAQYTYWSLIPTDRWFLFWVAALGFFSGIYFGWMPLCLPELFSTRVRSTGAGVSFNFGRILTAVTVFITGALTTVFRGDYAKMGQVTSLIFALGMLAILFVPDVSRQAGSK